MSQIKCALTLKVIAEYKMSAVTRINDVNSNVYFSYHQNRSRGTFNFVKKINDKVKWIKLGTYPELSVSDAKNLANALHHKYQMKQAQGVGIKQLSTHSVHTVKQLLNWFLAHKLAQQDLSGATKNGLKTNINKHLMPRLGHLKLKQLDRAMVSQYLMQPLLMTLRASSVQKILQQLKQACELAYSSGVIDNPLLVGIKLADFTTAKVKAKSAKLSPHSIAQVLKDIQQAPLQLQQIMLMMLLFGTRIGETTQMRWRDFNCFKRQWRIPAEHTKTNKTHLLPITEIAEEIFESYQISKKLQRSKSDWCFSVYGKWHTHCDSNNIGKQLSYHVKHAYSSHDLRKLVRTSLTELGVDYFVGEQILNHALSHLDAAYIFTHAQQQKLDALNAWHQSLLSLGLGEILKERRRLVRRVAQLA
jgi:integrase